MPEGKIKTPLRKAIDFLVASGKIDSDADLAEIFKLSKGTISTYINTKPGKDFKERFEEYFEIKLDDFSNSFSHREQDNYKDLYLKELVENKALIKKLHDTEAHCRFLEENIRVNLEKSHSNQLLMMRQIAVASRLIVENSSLGDPKKLQEGLNKIDRLIGAEAK